LIDHFLGGDSFSSGMEKWRVSENIALSLFEYEKKGFA
jgi:hypothetical protein